MRTPSRFCLFFATLLLTSSFALAQNRTWSIPYEAKVPGQQSGFATMVVRLIDDTDGHTLFQETLNVMISDSHFKGSLGPLTAALITPERSVSIEYARASTPDTVIGLIPLSAAAYAMTLSSNAEIKGASSFLAGLHLEGTQRALTAKSSSGGAALVGEATTSGTAFNAGVEAFSPSPTGAAGHFINTGGGDLIQVRNVATGAAVFRVTNLGSAAHGNVSIPEYGPQGERGDTGAKGGRGNQGGPGPRGPVANFRSFGIATTDSDCAGICMGRAVLKSSAAASCQLSSDSGPVHNTTSGRCCVCGL